MKTLTLSTVPRLPLLPLLGVLVIGLAWPLGGTAQDTAPNHSNHKQADKPADANKDLAAQVRELRAKTAKLEAALKQGHQGTPSSAARMGGKPMGGTGMSGNINLGLTETAGMMGKSGVDGMAGMKPDEMMSRMMQNMGQMMQMMGQMQGKGMGGMPMGMMGGKKNGQGMMGMGGKEGMNSDEMMKMMQMMAGMKGMEGGMPGMMGMETMGGKGTHMMAGMKGMGAISVPSALPGFPGASHIYHIGANGFFLDHPEHIKLTMKQQSNLNQIKEKAELDQASTQRKIDEAEQDLWTLTASDKPDATKIEAKVREIEKLRSDQRLAFIRAVGEAAKILTGEQRQALLGTAAEKPGKADAHTGD
jgi:Spy/CpxP family protein refolding chaperone